MSVAVTKVDKFFGAEQALSSLSFRAEKGEITGLLGPNGAGKSTMMNIITTYHAPSTGEVLVDGVNTQDDPIKVRRRVGYLPESNPLYEDMYVREFLVFMGRLYGWHGKALRGRVEEVVGCFGLEEKHHKKINTLSKGYQQRVGLARAFLHDPKVLILDEPTAGLDPNQLRAVRKTIRSLAETRTILFSTHILQEAQALCDKVIVLDKGQKVLEEQMGTLGTQQSTLEELFGRLTGTRAQEQ